MLRRVLWLAAGLTGILLVIAGLGAALLVLGLSTLSVLGGSGGLTPDDTLLVAAVAGSALGLGLPLAVHGLAGWRQRASSTFSPSRLGWAALAWALALGLGWLVSSTTWGSTYLLPLCHIAAMALPPLILLGLVGRILGRVNVTQREMTAGIASGGLMGISFSLIAEVLAMMVLFMLIVAAIALTPGGAERLQELQLLLQEVAQTQDPSALDGLLSSPLILLVGLVLVAVIVPVIEEAVKTLAIGVAGFWLRPHAAQSFLWGVASGAGFAIVENLFNGALGGGAEWGATALARLGASVMHCCLGGLLGWGWGHLWATRRPGKLLGLYAAAAVIHGIWNALATTSAFLGADSASSLGSLPAGEWRIVVAGLLMGLLVLLAVAVCWTLFAVARLLARRYAPHEDQAQALVPPEPGDGLPAPLSTPTDN